MKIILYRNDRPREFQIARCMKEGIESHGDTCEVRRTADYGKFRRYDGPDGSADLTIAYGVKSRDLLREHHEAGVPWCIMDKGYVRRSGPHGVTRWTRISVNETYPHLHFGNTQPPTAERWTYIKAKAKVEVEPLRKIKLGSYVCDAGDEVQNGHIVIAGSSQKFYDYFQVGDEVRFHSKLIRKVRKVLRDTGIRREIVFRPKPSYEKRHGEGEEKLLTYGAHRASMPKESIREVLKGAWCLVTFSSNAACDAIFAGVPVIVLGPHVSVPMANMDLSDIADPKFPSVTDRQRWMWRLGHEMWTLEEMKSGEAWEEIRKRIAPPPLDPWFSFKHWGNDDEEEDG